MMGVSYSREFSYILHRFPPIGRYRTFEISKKSGGTRQIDAPIRLLKKLQKRLVPLLSEIYEPAPCVRGFLVGQSTMKNASDHTGQRFVLNLDIENFFPSIHFTRVSGILQSSRYRLHRDVAVAIAQLACKDGFLPMGSPISGVLANIICGPLDASLLRLAKQHKLRYTRYADDITLSTSNSRHLQDATGLHLGDRFALRGGEELSDSFRAIFSQAGFTLNDRKIVLMSRRIRQSVTGLTINKKVNVSTEFYRNLKSTIHAIEKFGINRAQQKYQAEYKGPFDSDSLEEHVCGQLSYLGHIQNYSERYNRLARRVAHLFPDRRIRRPRDERERAIYVATNHDDQMMGTALYIGDGRFLTAAHIFSQNDGLRRCELICPNHYPGALNGVVSNIDFDIDIAMVRVAGSFNDQRPKILVDGKDARIGDDVYACGFPQYEEGNTISTIMTRITAQRYIAGQQRLEVDRPLAHGSSGGPVFSRDGFFVGQINTGPIIGEDYSPMSYTFTPFRLLADRITEWGPTS